MRKKDFEAIAGAIKDARDAAKADFDPRVESNYTKKGTDAIVEQRQMLWHCDRLDSAFNSLAKSIAAVCKGQNAKFDRERFLAGCGVK